MRLIFSCLIFVTFTFSSSTTDKIKKSNIELSKNNAQFNQINQKIQITYHKITESEKAISGIDARLDQLSKDHVTVEKSYKKLTNELAQYDKELQKTNEIINNKKLSLVKVLSQNLSLVAAIKRTEHNTQESVLSQEIYEKYKIHNQKLLFNLKHEIKELEEKRAMQAQISNATKRSLGGIKIMRDEFYAQKDLKVHAVEELTKEEEKYKNGLKDISNKQDALRDKLVKLNILRGSEIAAARKRAEAQQLAVKLEIDRKRKLRIQIANAKKSGKKIDVKKLEANSKSIRVQQINSSYKAEKTYSYQGGKTISPISGASVVKRFGTYEDPVYKIKIFNESITLQAPSTNSDVVSVLNGKVVFAGASSMLGNVVVVAHAGNIHTIYAGLSSIPSSVVVGTSVPKGYVIGRVSKKLIFETTKNSQHIDPLKLIQV